MKTKNYLLLAAVAYGGYYLYKKQQAAATVVASPTPTSGMTPQDVAIAKQAVGAPQPVEVVENYYIEDVPDDWGWGGPAYDGGGGFRHGWGGGWRHGGGGHRGGGHGGGHHH